MITLDGLGEEEFRRSIEMRLRRGLSGPAIERLRALIAPYVGPEGLLPERFLTVTPDDFYFYGWENLGESIGRHDMPGRPVTALSIAFGWPGEEAPVPDAEGRLPPCIEVGYYSDESFPFSQSARDDLLEGYSYHGCTWSGDFVAVDSALSLGGIDDLNGALARLEAELLSSEDPDEDGIRAGSLGACLLSALLFRAVERRIERDGLPRPLCVMSGSSGVYPYFDAPVVGMPVDALKVAESADHALPGPRYSSLLMTSIPRARKRAVLVLEDGVADEARRIATLRGMAPAETLDSQPEEPAAQPAEQAIVPIPGGPLLAKKAPRSDWDFREMLTPAGEAPACDEEPGSPEEAEAWDEMEAPSEPIAPPHFDPAPAPVFPSVPVPQSAVEPGFALLETDPSARLQQLLERQFPQLTPVQTPDREPAQTQFPSAPPPETDTEPASAPAPAPIARGRWARLRGWLARLIRR